MVILRTAHSEVLWGTKKLLLWHYCEKTLLETLFLRVCKDNKVFWEWKDVILMLAILVALWDSTSCILLLLELKVAIKNLCNCAIEMKQRIASGVVELSAHECNNVLNQCCLFLFVMSSQKSLVMWHVWNRSILFH